MLQHAQRDGSPHSPSPIHNNEQMKTLKDQLKIVAFWFVALSVGIVIIQWCHM
jgi:hypothetical protein